MRKNICYNKIMRKILCFLTAVLMMATVVCGSEIIRENAFAADCSYSFLGLKPWYAGLTMDNNCNIKTPSGDETAMAKFVWTIVGNVAYDISLVVGLVATGFIIFGGYLFITSEGDPNKAAKAKKTISSAVIGLVIAVLAAVIINTIIGVLNG